MVSATLQGERTQALADFGAVVVVALKEEQTSSLGRIQKQLR